MKPVVIFTAYLHSHLLTTILLPFPVTAEIAFTLLVMSLFFIGACHSGINCAYLDVSPNYSSIMNTIGNSIGAVAGLTGPLVVSAFLVTFEGSWG